MKRVLRALLICIIICCLGAMVSCSFGNKSTDGKTDTETNTQTNTNTEENSDTNTSTNQGDCRHVWKNIPEVEPTCTTPGTTKSVVCEKCDYYRIAPKEIPAQGHLENKIPQVPATCDKDGLTEGSSCKRCGELIVEQKTIPAKGHTEEQVPAVAPTCEEDGYTQGSICTECESYIVKPEKVPAKGHNEQIIPEVPATCDKGGLTEGTWCPDCEKIFDEQLPTGKLSHDYDYYGDCVNCDDKIGEAIIIVADISSSMKELVVSTASSRFEVLVNEISEFVKGLEDYDYIGIIAFNQDSQVMLQIQEAGDEENREAIAEMLTYNFNHSYYSYYIDKETGKESEIRINPTKDGAIGTSNIYVDGVDAKYTLPEDYNRGGADKATNDYIKSYGTAYVPAMQKTAEMLEGFDEKVISKKVVFISDGSPMDKNGGYLDLAKTLAEDDVSIDTVGLGLSPNDNSAIIELQLIAGAGNGKASIVQEKDDVTIAINSSYRKSDINGTFEKVGDFRFITINDVPQLVFYDGDSKDVVLPKDYNGEAYVVYNFSNILNENVESLVINGIATIKTGAFRNNTSLKSVTIGDSVTTIEDYAFENCVALQKVVIGDDVTAIGSYAFNNCHSLLSLTIGKGVVDAQNTAIVNNNRLVEIYNLSSIEIATSSSDLIAYSVLKVHTSLDEESILKTTEDGYVFAVLAEDDIRLVAYLGNDTELTLPDNFDGKGYKINDYAFLGSTNQDYKVHQIIKITIPKIITEIGNSAFLYQYELEEVHISDLESWCGISFGGSQANPLSCAKKLYVNGELLTSLVIPDTITEIKAYAFAGLDVESITIPKTVLSVGIRAFDSSNAKNVTIEAELTTISSNLFSNCDSLEQIVIPNTVTSIGSYAFYNCDSLEQIVIPDAVTSIGSYAFNYCKSLEKVTLPDGLQTIDSRAFYSCPIKTITIPSNVRTISSNAFQQCTALKEVYNLSSLNIEAGSESHGYVAYYALVVHTSLLEDSIFQNIDGFDFMVLEDGVYLVGYTGEETELTLPLSFNGETYIIKSGAFENQDDITKVVINGGVSRIEERAFYSCDSLETIEISDSVERIDGNPFEGCNQLKYNSYQGANYLGNSENPYLILVSIPRTTSECTLGSDIKFILPNAFNSLASDYEYIVDENLCYIGTAENPYYILVKTTSDYVTSCIIQPTVKYVLKDAFKGCDSLEELVVLEGTKMVIPTGAWKHGDTTYQEGDTIVAEEDIVLIPLYLEKCAVVYNQEELLSAISAYEYIFLGADIDVTTQLTRNSGNWIVVKINLNGHDITFDSSLTNCIVGQRFGLDFSGNGTITYEGAGVFAQIKGHAFYGHVNKLIVGKDVTIYAPNATLVNDPDTNGTIGYPMIEIYGTVVCKNIINVSRPAQRNPQVYIYDGASVTISGKVSAHAVAGNTTSVNISGGLIVSTSTEPSFFDDVSVYSITGGKFNFACAGDKEKLEAKIDSESYKVVETIEDGITYYEVKVISDSDFNLEPDTDIFA